MPYRSLAQITVLGLAGSLVGCKAKPASRPAAAGRHRGPRPRARRRRVGRVQRPARGGGPGGDPAPRLGLHQAARRSPRGARSARARCSSRSTPGPTRPTWSARRPSSSRRAPRPSWPQREVARAEKLVNVQAISREEFDSRTSAQANSVGRRAGRGGRRRDRPAQPRVDRGALADRRPGEPRRGDRGQPRAGRAARRDPAHDGGLARLHLPLLRQRRADLSALLRARRRGGHPRLARRALPGLPRAGQRDRLPPRGPAGLRGQPDRPGQRDHPHPRDLLQPRPPVHAGAVRPGEAGGQQERARAAGARRAPSAPTRTASSCWCSARATASSTARSRSAASVDGLRIVRKGVEAGEKVVVNGLMRVRPGMKVTPTVVAMVPDSSATRDSDRARYRRAAVAER